MFLKVDVESGKLFLKKSKDGPDDKFFVHNKSKKLRLIPLFVEMVSLWVRSFYYSLYYFNNYWMDCH